MAKMDTKAVGHDLQDSLVELADLALTAKQAHWNITGPNFRPLHRHLDEITADVRAASDLVAERAAAIGYSPDARSSTLAKNSPLPDFPEGQVADTEVRRLITERLELISERLTKRVSHLDKLDRVSQDILINVQAMIDKHHWMFAVQQEPNRR